MLNLLVSCITGVTAGMKQQEVARFRSIKREIRVLGIDDGGVVSRAGETVKLVGIVYRGGYWLDGVMWSEIRANGMDATERIASMILTSPHYGQLRVVILGGMALAGLNIVDIHELHEKTKLPVIVITKEKPRPEEMRKALMTLPKYEKRWKIIQNAGKAVEIPAQRGKTMYLWTAGISEEDAKRIVKITSVKGNIPEALRVARIVAAKLARLEGKV